MEYLTIYNITSLTSCVATEFDGYAQEIWVVGRVVSTLHGDTVTSFYLLPLYRLKGDFERS